MQSVEQTRKETAKSAQYFSFVVPEQHYIGKIKTTLP